MLSKFINPIITFFCSWTLSDFFKALIPSAIVGIIIYIYQKIKDDKKYRSISMQMGLIYSHNQNNGILLQEINSKLSKQLAGIPTERQQQIIHDEFKKAEVELNKQSIDLNNRRYIEKAIEYKVLADEFSERSINILKFDILTKKGKITKNRILKAHMILFPKDYTFSGKLRTQEVTIIGQFNATSRNINPMMSSFTTNV